MPNKERIMEKRAIRPEDAAVIYLISLGVYQIAGYILAAAMKDRNNVYIFLAYAIPQMVYLAATFLYFFFAKVTFRPLPIKSSIKASHYPFAIIVALGLFFFALLPATGMQRLFSLLGKNPSVALPDLTKPVSCVIATIIICIMPAIAEELVFRKVFCDAFLSYGKVAAIILSGVIFGLGHLNLAQTVHQIFLGWILAYIYVKTKNVTLTMTMHFINNFLALFLPRFTGTEIWNNYIVLGICCAVGAVVLAGGLSYFVLRAPRLKNKITSSDSVITAVYTEKGKVEISPEETEPEREKPSLFVIAFFVILTILWIITAVLS